MGLDHLAYMDSFGLPRSGIVHIGANNAGEARFYDAYAKVPVAFFEPIPAVYEKACQTTAKFPLQKVFHACCSDRDGHEVTFNVSSNRGMSSSMFPLGLHAEIVPGVTYVDEFKIKTSRAETILSKNYRPDDFNLAVIDTQGADLLALKGLGKFLEYIDAVYIEVSDKPMYHGGATFDEIYRYMDQCDFTISMLKTNGFWGNAFFRRREPVHVREAKSAISVNKHVSISSVLGHWKPEAGVDGDIVHRRKFFHTRKELNPWWKIDLGSVHPLKKILLFDRLQQQDRAKTLRVDVSVDDKEYENVYDRIESGYTGAPLTSVNWRGSARFVKLSLQEDNYLHMRQVAVIEDNFA